MFAVCTKWRAYSLGLLIAGLAWTLPALCDEAALLAAIRTHPNEDTPRLAYADWLMEFGRNDSERARGEFIRLQVDLWKRPDRSSAHFRETQQRAEDLLNQFRETWTPELFRRLEARSEYGHHSLSTNQHPARVVWRRGFIESISLNGNLIVSTQLNETLEDLPGLLSLAVEGITEARWMSHFVKLTALSRIRHLRVSQWFDRHGWAALSPRLHNLEELGIIQVSHGDMNFVIADLIVGPHSKRLRRLALPAHPQASTVLAPLLASRELIRLETLGINGASDDDLDLRALTPESLPALKNLRAVAFSLGAFERMVEHPRFRTLTQFGFGPRSSSSFKSPSILRLLERMTIVGENLLSVEGFGMEPGLRIPAVLQKRLDENRARASCTEILSAF